MIIDTSAVVAILFDEPEAESFQQRIAFTAPCRMSAVGYFEAAMVVEGRRGAAAARRFDIYLERASVELVSVTVEHARAARDAWRRYGRGNHPAALNFGDCFAYALAETAGEPLLYKGDDFALTDIERA